MHVIPRSSRTLRSAFLGFLGAAFLLLLAPIPVVAQLGGENVRGDMGLKSGSQAPPGWYLGDMFYFYDTDKVKTLNGDTLRGPDVNVFGNFFLFNHVTKKKLLGAYYGFTVAPAIVNTRLALPTLDVSTSTWGLADMYIQPFQLGWHLKQADAVLGYAFFAPVGRYTAGARDNTGLGMWSNEFSLGTTFYFDAGHKWHAAATGYYEIHSSKFDLDQKVGDLFTLEGGVGRAFLQGYANAGLAYYGQWKVTEDSGTDVSPLTVGKKGSMFGLGPELNMPLGRNPIFLTFRYLFDVRSRLATEGQSLVLSVVYAKPAAAPPTAPATTKCVAEPSEVIAGEPVIVTATAGAFDPKHTLTYDWASTGGKIVGNDTIATIETNGLAGAYIATARVSDPRSKGAGVTSCLARFTVNELPENPPSVAMASARANFEASATATIGKPVE